MNAWMWLLIAIIFEVSGTTCLKLSHGFSKLIPSLLTFIFYSVSFISLSLSLKQLEVSVAYAIWSGLGTILIAIVGVWYFGETFSLAKLIFISLIVMGVVGLNLISQIH